MLNCHSSKVIIILLLKRKQHLLLNDLQKGKNVILFSLHALVYSICILFLLFFIASVGTAAGLIGVCLAGCDINLHVTFFTMSLALGGFCTCGYMLSHLDLSPEYAGKKKKKIFFYIFCIELFVD